MLHNITLHNYRNIQKASIELADGVNLLVAKNGFGKTNFVESVYYSIFRGSFRPLNSYTELVGIKSEYTMIELDWDGNILKTNIAKIPKQTRSTLLNTKKPTKKTVFEKFSVILFAPHSVDLVNGEPKIRRDDFDSFISLLEPSYSSYLKEYSTVLKNRNAVIKAIKDGFAKKSELAFWTDRIVDLSSKTSEIRENYINLLTEIIPSVSNTLYHDVSELTPIYLPNVTKIGSQSFLEAYSNKFIENEEKELLVGKTLYGSHKDDYDFKFKTEYSEEPLTLKYHGSRGQQRIGSFLFKMGQAKILREKRDMETLLLLDDIMSELDSTHRNNIAKFLLNEKYQIILTGADINEIPEALTSVAKKIEI